MNYIAKMLPPPGPDQEPVPGGYFTSFLDEHQLVQYYDPVEDYGIFAPCLELGARLVKLYLCLGDDILGELLTYEIKAGQEFTDLDIPFLTIIPLT